MDSPSDLSYGASTDLILFFLMDRTEAHQKKGFQMTLIFLLAAIALAKSTFLGCNLPSDIRIRPSLGSPNEGTNGGHINL